MATTIRSESWHIALSSAWPRHAEQKTSNHDNSWPCHRENTYPRVKRAKKSHQLTNLWWATQKKLECMQEPGASRALPASGGPAGPRPCWTAMTRGGRRQLCRRLGPGAPTWMISYGISAKSAQKNRSRYRKWSAIFCRVHFAYIPKNPRTFAYIGKCGFRNFPTSYLYGAYIAYNRHVAFFARTLSYVGMPEKCRVQKRTFAYIRACLQNTPMHNRTHLSIRSKRLVSMRPRTII